MNQSEHKNPKPCREMSHRSKKGHSNENIIIEFCLMIKTIFPEEIIAIHTEATHKKLLEQLAPKEQKLVELLIHHLTKLYQNHRVQRSNGTVEIAEEDVLTALKIIEKLQLNTQKTQQVLNKKERTHYIKIREKYNTQLFTRKELQQFLFLSKSTANTFLNLLLENKLVEKYGFKNKGYYYKLLEINNLEENKQKKEMNLTQEIEAEFSDNKHYYKNEY